MTGTDAKTGKPLSGYAHLQQSIRDILTTPLGSRVMRPDYGSRLFELVDAPINPMTVLDVYAATAEALRVNEPRVRTERVKLDTAEPGQMALSLAGTYLVDGSPITLDGIVINT
ncbi:GPW/gp25 family protein [Aquabacterium sp.]|uniref:GPW/gp25 family protein n=1 Tax=Aquabacterium sp. TaxID=1872578 RepID=UPI003BAFBF9C